MNHTKNGTFAKGNNANPGGRPKISPEEREAWAALAIKGRARLAKMVDADETAPNVVTKITEIAANRAWGMPGQSIQHEAGDTPLEIIVRYVD
ncbi:MAG: hypothetical protein IMZ61_01205 [Planctomycetes bacterium]|nr:hypothetical protein [Planctomycetota bacterium]